MNIRDGFIQVIETANPAAIEGYDADVGCVVNGPGESKAANIGISLPGTGEAPSCPVYIDGQKFKTLTGTPDELAVAFREIIEEYVESTYGEAVAPTTV